MITPIKFEELKQKVAQANAGNHVEFTIEDNFILAQLRSIVFLVNTIYTASTGRGVADLAINEVFSEAMDYYIHNYPDFIREVLNPYQAITTNNLEANHLNQNSSYEISEDNHDHDQDYDPDQMIGQDAYAAEFIDKSS